MRNRIELPYAPPPRGFMLDPSHPLARGLVGWWPLNGDCADYSGGRNYGVPTNFNWDATDGYAAAKVGRGLLFDGVNDHVAVAHSASLSLTEFTVAAWFAWGSVHPDDIYRCIISKNSDGSGNHQNYQLYVLDAGPQIGGRVGTGAASIDYTSGINVTAGRWYQVALTHSSLAGTGDIWVNGASRQPKTGLLAAYTNTNVINIGRWPAVYGEFAGVIADVRIYNRALSAAEVKLLYERPFDMCIDPWPFRSYSIPATVGGYSWGRRATGIWSPGRA